MNKEKLLSDVIGVCSNHEMIEVKILRGSQVTRQVLKADIDLRT